jgi:glycine/D-amino acid oxidase-like deaminating enzyme
MDIDYRHIVIGGGSYGCFAALRLAQLHGGRSVVIIEQDQDIVLRASYNNQARVHNGYHYPRSLLTALRSRINAPRFIAEFKNAIYATTQQYYAVSRRRSNVTAGQFVQFCQRIGADIKPAPAAIQKLFNDDFIEGVFSVTEHAFDADKLRESLRARLEASGVTLLMRTEAIRVRAGSTLAVEIKDLRSGEPRTLRGRHLYNCTYSHLNRILSQSGLQTIRLRHEATEMALVEPPTSFRNVSLTVMCGPFFSLMPFPPLGLSTLSHVSYTPHYEWTDDPAAGGYTPHSPAFPLLTHFDRMRRDAARYLPALRELSYVRSLWEIKTILPQSGVNDSRPILFKRDPSAPNVISILGSKIDNIYDLDEALPLRHEDLALTP